MVYLQEYGSFKHFVDFDCCSTIHEMLDVDIWETEILVDRLRCPKLFDDCLSYPLPDFFLKQAHQGMGLPIVVSLIYALVLKDIFLIFPEA